MKAAGEPIEMIIRYTDLSEEKIERLNAGRSSYSIMLSAPARLLFST